MPLILGTNSIKDTGYDVDNSLRFNDGSSDYLSRTPSSTGNKQTWTYSAWIKRGTSVTSTSVLLGAYGGNNNRYSYIGFSSSAHGQDQIQFFSGNYTTGSSTTIASWINTDAVYRDFSAWYNIVIKCNFTESSASDVIKIYVNNVLQSTRIIESNATVPGNSTFFNTSGVAMQVGSLNAGSFFDGYMAEVVFVDGTALDPTSFGEFDEDSGIWKPIDVSGLTFGTNGFYLDFENSGSLGADVSGNGNNFTVNNLTAVDQSTDTCTNNSCVINSLDSYYESSTFSEGNLKIVTEASLYSYNTSTIGLTQGKWYCEVYIETSPHPTTKDSMIGIAGRMSEGNDNFLGQSSDTYGIYGGNGNIYNNGGTTSYGVSHTTDDVIGIYLDLDNNKLYFAKNGTIMNSGTGKDITAVTNTKAGAYFMVAADYGNGYQGTYRLNFGSPIYSLTSGNTDANGYGNFEYDPSAGTFDGSSKDFYAINTKNLAEYG